MRPKVGFSPKTPHSDAGTRIDPPVSVPSVGHQAGRHGGARSAGGAARRARQVVRIARRPVVRVLGGEAVCVLVHVQGTDGHGAGTPQRGHHRGILLGRQIVAIDFRAGERRQAGDIEKILDRKGRAGERTRIAAGGDVRIDTGGVAPCLRAEHRGETVVASVLALDSAQGRLGHLGSARAAGTNRCRDAERVRPLCAHGSNFMAGSVAARSTPEFSISSWASRSRR